MPDPIRIPVASLQGEHPRIASNCTESRLQGYRAIGCSLNRSLTDTAKWSMFPTIAEIRPDQLPILELDRVLVASRSRWALHRKRESQSKSYAQGAGQKKVICRRSACETGHPRQTPPNAQELHSAISVL